MRLWLIVATIVFAAESLFAGSLTFESAETQAALIELFTSEGCSSCPPADAWMSKLKASPDLWKSVVPVIFHVDYWNGLGWPDRFSSRANTERQHRYAAVWRGNHVYTPGFVLNGREWRDWSGRAAPTITSAARVGKLRVTLADRTHADVIFTPSDPASKALQVELTLLGGNLESDVKRGENSGRKLRHDFTVLYFATAAATWRERAFHCPRTASREDLRCAPPPSPAWVTTGDAQPPIQSTGGWLTPPP